MAFPQHRNGEKQGITLSFGSAEVHEKVRPSVQFFLHLLDKLSYFLRVINIDLLSMNCFDFRAMVPQILPKFFSGKALRLGSCFSASGARSIYVPFSRSKTGAN